MISFLLISLYAILKGIADTLKVPQTFNNSWFVRYKGVKWIDPLVIGIEPKNPIKKMFRDLWHTCQTLMICCVMTMALTFENNSYWPLWIYPLAWWVIYGLMTEFTFRTLKYFK